MGCILGCDLGEDGEYSGPPGPPGPQGPQGIPGLQGPPGASVSLFEFIITTNATVEPPSANHIEFDQSQTTATKMWIDKDTNDGLDISNVLSLLSLKDQVYLQDKDDSTEYQIYELTAGPIVKDGYYELPVKRIDGGNVISNGQRVLLGPTRQRSVPSVPIVEGVVTTPQTVSSLPPAGDRGKRMFVTDALNPVFGSVVVGNGSVPSPVYDSGDAWRVG